MTGNSPKLTSGDWGMLVLLSLIWGSSFLLIELGLTGFGPVTLVFLRMALAIPLMLLALRFMGLTLPHDRLSWWRLTLLGFLNVAFPMALFFWAQTRIESGLASILNATTPLWGVLFTHYFTQDERATPAKLLGVGVGFAGLVLMVGPDALAGVGNDVLAQLACLLATACFAAAAVYARNLGTRIEPLAASTGQIITATILLLPLPLLFEEPFQSTPPSMTAIAALLGLALLATSIAYMLFFRVIARAGASHAMLIALLMPPVAILLGVIFLGESLGAAELGGMALILTGLVIIDGRLIARLAPGRLVP